MKKKRFDGKNIYAVVAIAFLCTVVVSDHLYPGQETTPDPIAV